MDGGRLRDGVTRVMSWDQFPSTGIDMTDWSWVEAWTADLVIAAAEEQGVTMYGGLGWRMYLEVRWDDLRGLHPGQRIQVASALLRGDEETAQELISEFGGRPFARITKFKPGQHYHVLGEKFDSLGEAKALAAQRGYDSGAPETIFVYDRDGD